MNHCICHHGIKGQRWGRRRFQYEDGSLTPEGERRYEDQGNGKLKRVKSEHRIRLEDKYREKGMSDKTAEQAAARRAKTEKVIAAVAGLTVAAAATYLVTKEVRERADHIISAGDTLQRMTQNPGEDLNRAFYAAYDKSDKIRYEGKLGKEHFRGNNVHKVSIGTSSDVKVVSRKKAADVFADLYDHDPEFRKAFQESNSMFKQVLGGKAGSAAQVASGKMSPRQLRRQGYDAFNLELVNHDANGSAVSKKFYDKLKSMGYDAVMDINDQKFSGYGSKKPVIVFNSANMKVSDVKKLSTPEIEKAYEKTQKLMMSEQRTRALAENGAKATAALLGIGMLSSVNKTAAVNSYREEHPNTKLSDKEIEKMLNKR